MSTTVLVFTNSGSWRGLDKALRARVKDLWNTQRTETVKVMSDYPSLANPLVRCLEKPDAPVSLDPTSAEKIANGVYLVFDELDKELFDKIMTRTQTGESYVLVHTQGFTKALIPYGESRIVLDGKHEPTDPLYTPVFDILTDKGADKLQRIIKLLKPTDKESLKNTVLTFLIGCMDPKDKLEDESPAFQKAYSDLLSHEEISAQVRRFYEFSIPARKDLKTYREDLTHIRNILIGFALR